jgi:hypothetical protein
MPFHLPNFAAVISRDIEWCHPYSRCPRGFSNYPAQCVTMLHTVGVEGGD